MKVNKNIFWLVVKVIIFIIAIIFIIFKIYKLASGEWAAVASAVFSIILTLILTYELELKPTTEKINLNIDSLLKSIGEEKLELITSYDDFIYKATHIASNSRGRLFTMRVHTCAKVSGDDTYFEATARNLSTNNINLYRRIILVKNDLSCEIAKENIEQFGNHSQVEIKLWLQNHFPSMFELLLSKNEALIIFKSDEGPPKYCISVKNSAMIENLFGYYDKYWTDNKAKSAVSRGIKNEELLKKVYKKHLTK